MAEQTEGGAVPPLAIRVGDRLREAREARGMAISDVAQSTRVPQRHLESIEASTYATLPSITYAMGFTRAYARAVGADEVAIARDLRVELATTWEQPARHEPYDLTDPARVPPRGVAMAGVLVAVVLLVGVALWYGTGLFRTEEAPSPVATPIAATAPTAATPAAATPTGAGQVTLTATDEVWVRVYDSNDQTLLTRTMQPGERFDVPMGATDPMINIGRPDKLAVTIDGGQVAPLGPPERAIKDVRISAEALRARGSAATNGA